MEPSYTVNKAALSCSWLLSNENKWQNKTNHNSSLYLLLTTVIFVAAFLEKH
jgi:hypothetical protein